MTERPSDNAKETWHICSNEQGWEWGINCDACHTGRSFAIQKAPMASTVPGGYNDANGDARYEFQKNFDKGLEEYKAARDEGLQPESTTVEAVAKAKATVKSQEKAIKKLKLDRDERAQLPVAAGVDV